MELTGAVGTVSAYSKYISVFEVRESQENQEIKTSGLYYMLNHRMNDFKGILIS